MPRFDVTIAGELNMDLILYGLPETLPPERELLASNMALTLGGSSSIVAHNLAALGSKVGFVSCIGPDEFGSVALERLRAIGVDVSSVITLPNEKTGLTVILPRPAWRNMLTYAGTISLLSVQQIDFAYLSSAKHFHLSSYFLQTALQADLPNLLSQLRAGGLTISLDTNDDPADEWSSGLDRILPLVDVFLPNEREATRIAGTSDLNQAVEKLSALVPTLVVKRGAEGAIACRGSERVTVPAVPTDLVDSVGAGDSFDAGFIHAYVHGQSLTDCVQSGALAGALSVTKTGGTEAFRDVAHREAFLAKNRVQSAL